MALVVFDSDNSSSDELESRLVAARSALEIVGVQPDGWNELSQWDQRMIFREALSVALHNEHRLGLVRAEVRRTPGRLADSLTAWVITVRFPDDDIGTYQANLAPGQKPYTVSMLDELIRRVIAAATGA